MSAKPTASVVIPTRDRPEYLSRTLGSIAPQAANAGAEVIVVNDGSFEETERVARRHDAKVLTLPPPGGANAARNLGIEAAASELIVLVDDDVDAPSGWLAALLTAAETTPDVDVFGGPIRARLEGGRLRSCGRESAPITTLDLGASDRDAEVVWSANMALRRRALERVGRFDETIRVRGDEEEWERRYIAAGGRVRYVAAAGLEHRRTAADSTIAKLSRAAFAQGRAARRYDTIKHCPPPAFAELRTLAGCAWHIVRRRCANGIVMTAHSLGRVREMLTPRAA